MLGEHPLYVCFNIYYKTKQKYHSRTSSEYGTFANKIYYFRSISISLPQTRFVRRLSKPWSGAGGNFLDLPVDT